MAEKGMDCTRKGRGAEFLNSSVAFTFPLGMNQKTERIFTDFYSEMFQKF